MSELGYLGTDMVLDQHRGPLMLELNARPGLAIQIANGMGILPRLQHVEKMGGQVLKADQRIDYAKAHFSHCVNH